MSILGLKVTERSDADSFLGAAAKQLLRRQEGFFRKAEVDCVFRSCSCCCMMETRRRAGDDSETKDSKILRLLGVGGVDGEPGSSCTLSVRS